VLVHEIAPDIWRWAAPYADRRVGTRASFAVAVANVLVLVDPLVPEDVWPRLDELAASHASVAALITIPFHVRSGEEVVARYGQKASLWGHRAVGTRLRDRSMLRPIEPGVPLPGDVEALAIGSPRRQEMPLWFPSHRALAFGDAVVGVDGTLRVWEVVEDERRRAWYRNRLVPTLEPLLALEPEHVLVTHGPPIVGGGREALAQALAADPWHFR
jgi:hypothetical protein